MVIGAIIALILGVFYGLSDLDINLIHLITDNSNMILYVLMFLVGISIGFHKGIFQKIKEYHIKIFIIPFGIIVGSLIGGIICSFFTGYELRESTAIASGLGWYSLSGILITENAGVHFGSIAFISNLAREIFSFFCIPFIAKHLNYFTCIAPAGATSEDTTLPMMMKYTNEETVVMAVLNGAICSACVPILIKLCFQFF